MQLNLIVWILAMISTYISLVWLLVYFKDRHRLKESYGKLESHPKVSIAIPAYNEGKNVEISINSLMKSDYPKNKLEIIVVDDGSTDNTLDVLRSFEKRSDIKVINQSNRGKGAALNNALKHATGEIFGVMDADTLVEKDTITKIVLSYTHNDVGAVVSAIKPHSTKSLIERFQKIEYLMAILARKLMDSMETNFVTPGAISLYNKNLVKSLGGFDENNLTEDLEIGLRLRDKGHNIRTVADAFSYTIVPTDIKGLFNQRLRWNRGMLQNLWKYRHMLFNPKYKNLGIYQLSIVLLTVYVLVPAGFSMLLYSLYEFLHMSYLYFSAVGFAIPPMSFALTMQSILLNFNYVGYFPIAITVFLAMMLIAFAHNLANESWKNIFMSTLTIVLYYPFLGLVWIFCILYEILGIKTKW